MQCTVDGHLGATMVHAVAHAEAGLNSDIDHAPIHHPAAKDHQAATAKDLTLNQKDAAQIPVVRSQYQQL